jgi:hypothetical protein
MGLLGECVQGDRLLVIFSLDIDLGTLGAWRQRTALCEGCYPSEGFWVQDCFSDFSRAISLPGSLHDGHRFERGLMWPTSRLSVTCLSRDRGRKSGFGRSMRDEIFSRNYAETQQFACGARHILAKQWSCGDVFTTIMLANCFSGRSWRPAIFIAQWNPERSLSDVKLSRVDVVLCADGDAERTRVVQAPLHSNPVEGNMKKPI